MDTYIYSYIHIHMYIHIQTHTHIHLSKRITASLTIILHNYQFMIVIIAQPISLRHACDHFMIY